MSDEQDKPHDGAPPENQGEGGKPTPKMLSEEEAKAREEKLRKTFAKQISERDTKLAKFEAEEEKRKQASLSDDERRAKDKAEVEELRQWKKSREESDAAELVEIEEENKAAIRALKKDHPDLADLVPDMPPKGLAKWLARFRDKLTTKTLDVHGGGGRGSAPLTDEEKRKAHEDGLAQKGMAFIFGAPKKAKS